MGFCHYCGEISLGKCSRCGGRSVESTISSMISDNGISIMDKWQSQYEDTILVSKDIFNKSPPGKRIPVTQSTFYDTIRKACVCCSTVLDHRTAAIIEDNKSYCKDCHIKLFNKGECSNCKALVLDSQKFIEYGQGIWHKNCFKCFGCDCALENNPMVDLQNRPCCEDCFMKQAGKRTVKTNVSSSPFAQKATRTAIHQDFFKSPSPPPPSPPSNNNKSTTANISKPIKSSIAQKPCPYCHKPLGETSQNLIKIRLNPQEFVWFHKPCFLCSKCHRPFTNGQCTTDGVSYYHSECDVFCNACDKSIQTDAFIFNHKKYHFNCFKCFASGCQIKLGDPVFEVNSKPFCQSCYQFTLIPQQQQQQQTKAKEDILKRPRAKVLSKLGGFNTCPRCKQSISIMDDTPGPFASHWHKKCLCCAKCSKQLDSGAKMRTGNQNESLVYCRNCII